jgi:hypothetical protein
MSQRTIRAQPLDPRVTVAGAPSGSSVSRDTRERRAVKGCLEAWRRAGRAHSLFRAEGVEAEARRRAFLPGSFRRKLRSLQASLPMPTRPKRIPEKYSWVTYPWPLALSAILSRHAPYRQPTAGSNPQPDSMAFGK